MLDCIVIETKDVEPVIYEWGAVKWVANNDLAPGCAQSFGLVHILPGKTNPEHWHTTAEEIVFMLQGECDVRLGHRDFRIGPGQTLFIPQGVKSTRSRTRAGSRWSTSAPSRRACAARSSTTLRLLACDRCPAGAEAMTGKPDADLGVPRRPREARVPGTRQDPAR
jgi:hypothetical protein